MIPLEEQKGIAAHLDSRLARVEAMMECVGSLITPGAADGGMIVEYWDALITAVVTGKIDLCGEVA